MVMRLRLTALLVSVFIVSALVEAVVTLQSLKQVTLKTS